MKSHKFDRKWVAFGVILIITGIAFLAKGPVTWFIEWLEEGQTAKAENSTKVWDIDGKEITD